MPSVYNAADAAALEARIAKLTPATVPQWGKMTVDQMLAHCNVAYDMAYTDKYPKAGAIKRFFATLIAKPMVVGPKPYRRNTPTAPEFRQVERKDFACEREKLLGYVRRVQQDGAAAFEGRESLSFGRLTAAEWDVLFHKHLDHHLTQFGV